MECFDQRKAALLPNSAPLLGGAAADLAFDPVEGGNARQGFGGDWRGAALGEFVKVAADMGRKRCFGGTFRSGGGRVIVGAAGGSDTCRFQSINICRSRSGASRCSRARSAAQLVRGEKAAIIAESYGAGETVCARRAPSWADAAATVRLAPAGAAIRLCRRRRVRAGGGGNGSSRSGRWRPWRRAGRAADPSVDGIELEIAGVEVRVGADAKPRSIEAVIRALKATS